jgi:hypothetical protein
MPVHNATASVRTPKNVSLDLPSFTPSFTPSVQASATQASRDDDAFTGTSKGSSGASPSLNPLDPFGVAQFWLQNNPVSIAQNLMLAAQVYSRGPFGGPLFMGPFY